MRILTWGEFIQPLALLVGLFSLVIGVVVILAVRSIPISQVSDTVSRTSLSLTSSSSTGVSINIETIVAASIFFGISTMLKTVEKQFRSISIIASIFVILLGIAGWISIGYQKAGYLRDLTPWLSVASILIGVLYGFLIFLKPRKK